MAVRFIYDYFTYACILLQYRNRPKKISGFVDWNLLNKYKRLTIKLFYFNSFYSVNYMTSVLSELYGRQSGCSVKEA